MKIYRIPMVPGPVSVSQEVLEAGQENFGSADLEKEYIDLYKATEKSLRKIMQTKNSVVIQTGEGMLALWSALKSCLLPGDKVLVLSTGLFGYGMGGMAEAIGCEVRTVGFGFDETFTDFDLIEKCNSTDRYDVPNVRELKAMRFMITKRGDPDVSGK